MILFELYDPQILLVIKENCYFQLDDRIVDVAVRVIIIIIFWFSKKLSSLSERRS